MHPGVSFCTMNTLGTLSILRTNVMVTASRTKYSSETSGSAILQQHRLSQHRHSTSYAALDPADPVLYYTDGGD